MLRFGRITTFKNRKHKYLFYGKLKHMKMLLQQEIRSVEHGICPIAEFTSPYWIVHIVTEYRILFSVDVVMYMYCLKY